MHRVLVYHEEPRTFPTIMIVPGFLLRSNFVLIITLLVLGVFGAGFIKEIWRIAVMNCAWIGFAYQSDRNESRSALTWHPPEPPSHEIALIQHELTSTFHRARVLGDGVLRGPLT
jgi:hypothetical protein